MNEERLMAVKAKILKYPKKSIMHAFHSKGRHCILGWAQVLYSPNWKDRIFNGRYCKDAFQVSKLAELLGISRDDAMTLLSVGNWPVADFTAWCRAGDSIEIQARAIANRIDSFIAEKRAAA